MENETILNRLFESGDFEPILEQIFLSLDASSLEASSLVSKSWRNFILRLVNRKSTYHELKSSWLSGVSTSRRIQLGSRFMALKTDATSLVFGLEDGSIEVWERQGSSPKSGQPFKRLGPLQGHSDLVRVVDLSPQYIISASWDSTVKLWSRETGTILQELTSEEGPISGLHLCESGNFALYSARSGKVRRIHLDTFETDDKFLMDHGDCIIDMSVDGANVVTGGSDAKLKLFTYITGRPELVRTFVGHTNGIRCVYLKGKYTISGSRDQTAKLWELSSGNCLRTITHTVDVRSVFFNSFAIFTGDEYTDLFMWSLDKCADPDEPDTQNNEGLLIRTFTGHNGLVHTITASSLRLISCDLTGLVIERDFWNCIEPGPSLRILRCQEGVNCMACDANWIVCGLLNKTLAIFDRKSLDQVATLKGHSDHIWSVDMNSNHIISGSWDTSVNLWQKFSWTKADTFAHPDQREISGVRFSKDGKLVYATCLSGALTILKLEGSKTLVHLRTLNCQSDYGEIYSLAVDDIYLVTGHTLASTCVQVWNIVGEDLVANSTMRENSSESIIWNLHLAYPLALVCRDNETLDIYHLESHSCLKSLRHESKVLNATLYKKQVVVVGCQYGLLVFWHLKTVLEDNAVILDINHSSCLKILSEHSGAIANVHIDQDELITDDYDGVVILRRLKTHSGIKDLLL